MKSLYEMVYGFIQENAGTGGWVDMDQLSRTLRDAGIEPECYDDAVKTLEDQGFLMVWSSGELVVPTTGWRCDQCGGIVGTWLTEHIDDCLKRQRKLRKIIQEQASRSRATGDRTRKPE